VLRDALFLSVTYQRDFQQFFEHPIRRLQRVKEFREHGAQARYDYGGMDASLAGLAVDWATERVTFSPDMRPPLSEAEQREYASLFFRRPPQTGRNRTFETRWLGALVDLYRNSKTKIILFQAPRSPSPRPLPLAHFQWTIVDELQKRPW